jgi:EpsI family protein
VSAEQGSTSPVLNSRLLPALFLLSAAAFLSVLPPYLALWSEQPYTHGLLVAAATAWLVWRERDGFHSGEGSRSPFIVLTTSASLVWLVATIADVRALILASVPLVLLGWSGAAFGSRPVHRLLPVAALFLLAVPVWEVTIPVLQQLTVWVSGAAVRALGISAVIEGSDIRIQSGTFLIEGGCAGLNYLMAGLSVSGIYALVFSHGWPARALIVGLGAGLAVVSNWVRVASLIVIGQMTSMESALMNEHLAYGWVIFAVGQLVFFALAPRAERLGASHAASIRSEPQPRSFTAPRLGTALAATAATLVGPFLFYLVGALPAREPEAFEWTTTPAAWRAVGRVQDRPYAWSPGFVGASDHATSAWTDGTSRVLVDLLTYREQDQGAELIGYASRIAPDSLLVLERLFGQVGPERRLVNEAIVRERDGHVLVWHWYRIGGIETQSSVRAKALEVLAFFRRLPTSELIAISTPCAPSDCAVAAGVLARFLGDA